MAEQRLPVAAGLFYEKDPGRLLAELEQMAERAPLSEGEERNTRAAKGLVVPHAGYRYCGQAAASVYLRVRIPSRCVMLGPNHTGMGEPCAVCTSGEWMTPLGPVPVDQAFTSRLLAHNALLTADDNAHLNEHAIEVQLPWLMFARGSAPLIVPMSFGSLETSDLDAIGRTLAAVMQEGGEHDTLLIASTDLNHGESQGITLKKDQRVIDAILALDERELFRRVMHERVSMCGMAPAYVMLVAAKALGAREAVLVDHYTSGDITHDYEGVVGYAGIIIQ